MGIETAYGEVMVRVGDATVAMPWTRSPGERGPDGRRTWNITCDLEPLRAEVARQIAAAIPPEPGDRHGERVTLHRDASRAEYRVRWADGTLGPEVEFVPLAMQQIVDRDPWLDEPFTTEEEAAAERDGLRGGLRGLRDR